MGVTRVSAAAPLGRGLAALIAAVCLGACARATAERRDPLARPAGAAPPRTAPVARPPTEAAAAMAAPSAGTHRVAPGETAYRIAKLYGVTVEALAAANDLSDPTRLQVGQVLAVPGGTPGPATPGPATPGAVAPGAAARDDARPTAPKEPVARAPEAVDPRQVVSPKPEPPRDLRCGDRGPKAAPASKDGFAWPVDGVVVARFGHRDGELHEGIDIAAPVGTPIRASAEGEVVYAGEQPGYGRIVILQHPGEWLTIYARNAANCVATGERVRRGELLGLVGQSGGATAPHLHFELRSGQRKVNPRAHLPR